MIKHTLTILFLLLYSTLCSAQVSSFMIDSSKLNRPLMVILDSLYQEDQTIRLRLIDVLNKKGNTTAVDSLRAVMREKDQSNLAGAEAIISKYGWLGPQKIGINASQGLFMLIQHADLTTQKKYLPMIRTAEKNGEILSSNLAILEDRINMREGRNQCYGSQTFNDKRTGKLYIYPIDDPDHLDERRKSMGLIPMKDYVALFHIEWDVEAYKKTIPEIKEIAEQHKL